MSNSPSDRFKKYGQIFDEEAKGPPSSEPESPYESLPYVKPEKRTDPVQDEGRYLDELRGGKRHHYD
jgi:hypothetical protein